MERPKIIRTDDGSHTLSLPGKDEHYHSTYGALNESRHVFIAAGLREAMKMSSETLSVLEIGFGTGLNALLSYNETKHAARKLRYTAIEAFPLEKEIWEKLNYPEMLQGEESHKIFDKMHRANWDEAIGITPFFELKKLNADLRDFDAPAQSFDLVYFDAFAPDVQPELWTQDIFRKVCQMARPGGILVTYSCKGVVKRALKSAGFSIEKLPGPKGKREMLRARKG